MEENDELLHLVAKVMAVAATTGEVIQSLIETHPDPVQLHLAWQRRTSAAVDGEMDTPPFNVDTYREAYLENMRGISQCIARAVIKQQGLD